MRPSSGLDLRVETLREGPSSARPRAVAIGNFDGVHRGHRSLIEACVAAARRLALSPVALTFDPHPASVVSERGAPPRIQTRASRRRALREAGLDELATLAFDRGVAQLSPLAFIERALIDGLAARAVVVGHGFRFGAKRAGDVDALRQLSRGRYEVVEVPSLEDEEGRISSSRMRGALGEADIPGAERLIGRPYEVEGVVVQGDARGRTIGFPTANLEVDGLTALAAGVYAADGLLPGESTPRRAAVNFGLRPTFDGGTPRFEAHFPGFGGDLYGKVLRLRLLERLRCEQRFASSAELVARIAEDVSAALLVPERPWPR